MDGRAKIEIFTDDQQALLDAGTIPTHDDKLFFENRRKNRPQFRKSEDVPEAVKNEIRRMGYLQD